MRLYHLILLVAFFFVAAATPSVIRIFAEAERAKQHDEGVRPRLKALLCWHEFESGRRATTADCPEL